MATTIESGLYSGDTRTIIADSPIVDYMFDQWTGDIGALNDETLPTAIVNMSSTNVVVTATYKLIPPALRLSWDSILNVPVADVNSLSDWNLFFDLPTNGGEFTSVVVIGNEVNLIGGTNITLKDSLFGNSGYGVNLIKIEDFTNCVVAANYDAFGDDNGSGCPNLTTVSLPVLAITGDYCFGYCQGITSIYVPLLVTAAIQTFENCQNITSLSLPVLTSAGVNCFGGCQGLTNLLLPSLVNAYDGCFSSCNSLTELLLPSLITAGDYCFSYCSLLTNLYVPVLESAGINCFINTNISGVSFPSLKHASTYCFASHPELTTLSLPALLTADENCFYFNVNLLTLSVPLLQTAANWCFNQNVNLTTIYAPSLITIGHHAFYYSLSLNSLDISSCTNLGTTVGDDNVFTYIVGQTFTLTIPSALMTCNAGSPDGDIQYLIDNNDVIINGVS